MEKISSECKECKQCSEVYYDLIRKLDVKIANVVHNGEKAVKIPIKFDELLKMVCNESGCWKKKSTQRMYSFDLFVERMNWFLDIIICRTLSVDREYVNSFELIEWSGNSITLRTVQHSDNMLQNIKRNMFLEWIEKNCQ